MKKIILWGAMMGSLISVNAFAHNIQPNQLLANVTVSDKGEITLNGNDVAYKSWSSTALPGKVRVIQHIAGRSAAKEKNQAMIDAIKASHFNPTKYQTTTIINADDAIVGTGMFVKSSAEKGKVENPHSQVVLDDKSAVKNAWALNAKESAIIVLDKNGKVKFVKEGQLSASDIEGKFDLIISNPPFHDGIDTAYRAVTELITQAKWHLNQGGELRIVANAFLPYPELLRQHFGDYEVVAQTGKFKVYSVRN